MRRSGSWGLLAGLAVVLTLAAEVSYGQSKSGGKSSSQTRPQASTPAPATRSSLGRTREEAVVLLPLPFDQESDEFTLVSTNQTFWFLFYARANQPYSFLFPHPPKVRAGLKAEIEAADGSVKQTLSIDMSNTNLRQSLLEFTPMENGNHYLRVTLTANAPFKGRFIYLSGTFRPARP